MMLKVGGAHGHSKVTHFVNKLYNSTLGRLFGKWNLKVKSKPNEGSPKEVARSGRESFESFPIRHGVRLDNRNIRPQVHGILDRAQDDAVRSHVAKDSQHDSFASTMKRFDTVDMAILNDMNMNEDFKQLDAHFKSDLGASSMDNPDWFENAKQMSMDVPTGGETWVSELDAALDVKKAFYETGNAAREDMEKRLNHLEKELMPDIEGKRDYGDEDLYAIEGLHEVVTVMPNLIAKVKMHEYYEKEAGILRGVLGLEPSQNGEGIVDALKRAGMDASPKKADPLF